MMRRWADLICFTGRVDGLPAFCRVADQNTEVRKLLRLPHSVTRSLYLYWTGGFGMAAGACTICIGFLGNLCNISINTQAVGVEVIVQALHHGHFSWPVEPGRFYGRGDRYIDGI
jgi:hypothetical protein